MCIRDRADIADFDFDDGHDSELLFPAVDAQARSDEPLVVEFQIEEVVPVPQEAQQRIIISPALYEIFSEEAKGHLATLHRELSVLENDTSVATPHDMYRAAHTLAGISATVGIISVNQLGLALEHALLRRDHSAHPGSLEAIGIIGQSVSELDMMLSALAEQRDFDAPLALSLIHI